MRIATDEPAAASDRERAAILARALAEAAGAAAAHDAARVREVCILLMEGLDFTANDVAPGLLRLYDYCITASSRGEFAVAGRILGELAAAWDERARST
jgi:hypothetical protein